MTRIIIRKTTNGEYAGFNCQGHAEFARKGKDIVCAALSILTINTINSLEKLTHEKMEVEEDEKAGIISCSFKGSISDESKLLVDSYVLGCQGVFQSYGNKYVELEFKEV